MFWIKQDIDINKIKFVDDEVIDVKWITLEEFTTMHKSNQLAGNMNFNLENISKILDF